MKCSAHSKTVLDDSWITVDTPTLYQHQLYYCDRSYLSYSEVNSNSCVIQNPDQGLGERKGAWHQKR